MEDVWNLSMRITREVYRAVRCLPDMERYGLRAQMTRSAVSVSSDIAEGYDRGTRAEYVRFVNIARGSAAELETQAIIARDIGLLAGEPIEELLTLIDDLRKILWGLAKALERKKRK
jgi:four helix bundle protein